MKNKKQSISETQKLKEQVELLETKWKRAAADYANLEKRVAMQQAEFVRLANAGLIEKLLAILDDLERAAGHIKDKGLQMILKQFNSVLRSEGLEEIRAEKEQFNPETMDCVEMKEGKNNQVIEVRKKGYKLNGKVLRPAEVVVGVNKSRQQ